MTTAMTTAHRTLPNTDWVQMEYKRILIKLEVDDTISGAAKGGDTIFARASAHLAIPFRLYLPNWAYPINYNRVSMVEQMTNNHWCTEVIEVKERRRIDAPAAEIKRVFSQERWWVDNFNRNIAMVSAADVHIACSTIDPRTVTKEMKGGTVACIRDLLRFRKDIIWMDPVNMRTVKLNFPKEG